MPTDDAAVLSGERIPVFATADVREAELAGKDAVNRHRRAWDGFIDRCLVEWGHDTSALEDEGFTPPGLGVIHFACEVAASFRDEGLPPPTRVVPDGEGGICFERVDGPISVSLNLHADKSAELLTFEDCRLCSRHRCV